MRHIFLSNRGKCIPYDPLKESYKSRIDYANNRIELSTFFLEQGLAGLSQLISLVVSNFKETFIYLWQTTHMHIDAT
jgi:hypothetical protein